jgi:hypothetical protein
MWCDDFARYVDPEDMFNGQERALEVVSDATRLHSFVALRKLDEFLRLKKAKEDDLIAKDLNIDAETVLIEVAGKFLTAQEREDINKGAAHLTERLTLDPDTEVDLHKILRRCLPVLFQLISELRKINNDEDTVPFLDRTEALVQREIAIETQRLKEPNMPRP